MKRCVFVAIILMVGLLLWGFSGADAGCLNTAEADTAPAPLVKVSPGKWHYNYDVEASRRTGTAMARRKRSTGTVMV